MEYKTLKKKCNVCRVEKPLDAFSPSEQCRYGVMNTCRLCRNEKNRAKRNTGKHYVYLLIDPITKAIQYVGRTACTKERLKGHIDDARLAPHMNPPKAAWINGLIALGMKPRLEVIEKCTKENVVLRERYWIIYYWSRCTNLLNGHF